jgi:hypothetical protein
MLLFLLMHGRLLLIRGLRTLLPMLPERALLLLLLLLMVLLWLMCDRP